MQRFVILVPVLAVLTLLSGCARNQPPEIIAAKAFPEGISVGDSTDLIVSASDPENGRLKYKWVARDGKLSSAKDSVTKWTAPAKPGTYKATVTVTDPKGAAVAKSFEIKVTKPGSMYSGSLGNEYPTRRARGEKVRSSRKGSDAGGESPRRARGRTRK
jgi:hypothetical protein